VKHPKQFRQTETEVLADATLYPVSTARKIKKSRAGVAESVDAADSKSVFFGSGSSSLPARTSLKNNAKFALGCIDEVEHETKFQLLKYPLFLKDCRE
jgi:hypothetical protein